MKVCSSCEQQKDAAAFRQRTKRQGDSVCKYLESRCRECERAIQARVPKDRKAAIYAAWRNRHPEATKERERVDRETRKDQRAATFKAWYSRNSASQVAKASGWARSNKGKLNARRRAAYAADPVVPLANSSARRAKLLGCTATLTAHEWRTILGRYGNCCAYCGRGDVPMTKDHVLPLSRGGEHSAANVVPACKPCNSSKRTRTPEEWQRPDACVA